MIYYNVGGYTFDITNLKRMVYYKNFLAKGTAYGYGSSDYITVTESGNQKLKSNKYNGYGRDEFYTNMVYAKSDSNSGTAKSYTTFSYPYEGNNSYSVDSSDSYSSNKNVSSLEPVTLNNSSSSYSISSSYRVYPLHNPHDFYLEQPDLQGITKLISESTNSNGNLQVNQYYYEKGDYVSSGLPGFRGSFLMKNKANTMGGVTRLWNYSYEYQGGIYSYDTPLRSLEETDPFNNKIQTTYINFYEEDFIYKIASNSWSYQVYDNMCFYKIQVDSLQLRKDNSNNILSKKLFEYISRHDSSIGYYGQLRREKNFNNYNLNDFIQTEYEYYRNDVSASEIYHWDFYPNKNGNLKTVTKPNGQQEKYYYHMVTESEIYAGDTINLTDEEPYRRHAFKMKFNNGTVKDTCATMWDTRFPIRIDNFKINGSQTATLSKVYKTYNIAGYPTRKIDQNLYVTEFKYQPIHRINSITLPGDFSTTPDSVSLTIDTHYIKTSIELISKGWGNYNTSNQKVAYTYTPDYSSLKTCGPFNMFINNNTNRYAFIKLDTSNKIYNFETIDSAILQFAPIKFSATYDGSPISNESFNTQVKGVTYLSNYFVWANCELARRDTHTAHITTVSSEIDLDTFNTNCSSSCCYKIQKFDIKNLIDTFITNRWPLIGLTIQSYYNGIGTNPATGSVFDLNFTNCPIIWNGNHQYWNSLYRPVLYIYGNLDISDTLRIPIVRGGTIKYTYDDVNKKIDVFSIRNTLTNDYSKVRYSIDGFGNIKQKDIYTDASSFNSYKYNFNYMNKISRSLNPLNDSTMYSYDGLERLIKTKNPDTSSTQNFYSFYNGMGNYFGNITGLIEKQTFMDEEGNHFEKYFNAVGNLAKEIKYVDGTPVLDNPGALITDYKHDSLYRVTKVKTPEGKIIHYTYDGYGRQSKRITPDAGQTDYIYDKNSNLIYSQDANQRTVHITTPKYTFRNYDGLNRLTGIGEALFGIENPSNEEQYQSTSATDYLVINVYDTLASSIVNNLFTAPSYYTSPLYTKGNLVATAYRTKSNENWSFKYYRYDTRGRVIKMWNIIADFDTFITEYNYNSQDQVTSYIHIRSTEFKRFRNHYDVAGRLAKVDYYTGDPETDDPENYTDFCSYSYNENSQVLEQVIFDGVKNNYYYNKRNWIIELLNTDGIFGYTNDYFKNGNVKSQNFIGTYKDNFAKDNEIGFNYTYDKSNRLLTSSLAGQTTNDYKLLNTYNKDGNILTLDRYGSDENLLDDFAYTYYSGTNKLQRVSGGGNQFTYDDNGNVISESLNNNSDIKYDHRNLITQLKHRSHIITDSSYYVSYYKYDEAGNRIAKITFKYTGSDDNPDAPGSNDAPSNDNWELVSDIIYSRDVSGRELAIYNNTNLIQWNVYGLDNIGKINSNESKYYYLKDHLGSVRAEVNENGGVVSSQDYDAWGYLLEDRKYQMDSSRYKFTGKERDVESDYDYFGARYYDARIGRWGQIEPFLDEYPQLSPYNYSLNNPLRIIDPDGASPNDLPNKLHITSPEDIIQSFNETMDRISSGYDKLFSGDFEGAALQAIDNAIESPRLVGGMIPGDFTTDFMLPLGMVKQSTNLLKLGKGLTIKKQAEQISKFINKNSINLGDETLDLIDTGSKLGYTKGHFNKSTGKRVKVPHVQKNIYYFNKRTKTFGMKRSKEAIPATNEHIQRGLDIINNIGF